jgi:hypothetical protein
MFMLSPAMDTKNDRGTTAKAAEHLSRSSRSGDSLDW